MEYDRATVDAIIAKLSEKLKRQQSNMATTTMELEHWRQIQSKRPATK